jgi:hypothetical protein
MDTAVAVKPRAKPLAKSTYYDDACRAMAQADTVDEVAEINNEAIGMEAYAKRAKNKDLEIQSRRIRFKSTRRIGQMMELQRAAIGLAKRGPGKKRGSDADPQIPRLEDAESEGRAGKPRRSRRKDCAGHR